MPAMTPAEVAQLYNGIYGPAEQGPMPIAAQSIEEMYRGIYGPANATPRAPTPPSAPPMPDVYNGIFGPANLSSEPGSFPNFGSLLDMFPGSSQTKTEHVTPAAPNGTGYQADLVKADNTRLLPGLPDMFGGQPPSTRRVQSVPMGGSVTTIASIPTPGMPRVRPPHTPAATALASLFAPSAAPASRSPLRVTVNGGNAYVPTPAPASQRPVAPAAPRQQTSAVQGFRDQGYSPSESYARANAAAQQRAEAGATSGHSVSGGRQYDPSSGQWR